jgi:hypothetical protein
MKNDVERIRATLAGMQRGRGRRFSPETRKMIADGAGKLRDEGQSWTKIGQALGLPPETPRRLWLARTTSTKKGSGAFLRVAVADDGGTEVARSGLVVVSPSGFRVEGLDVMQAADLLRRLG